MNEKMDPFYPFGDQTLKEMTEVTQELLRDVLDVVSATRISKQRTLDVSCSGPLARDLLLYWASQAMAARSRLLFWMETNGYASGLRVRKIGTDYTLGSQLAMELISTMPNVLFYTELLKREYEQAEYDIHHIGLD